MIYIVNLDQKHVDNFSYEHFLFLIALPLLSALTWSGRVDCPPEVHVNLADSSVLRMSQSSWIDSPRRADMIVRSRTHTGASETKWNSSIKYFLLQFYYNVPFVSIFSLLKNKHTQPHNKKLCVLLEKSRKIFNKIICD